MFANSSFPPQMLSLKSKGKEWRQQNLDWADTKSYWNYGLVRNTAIHKKINYDLVNGIIHMKDIANTINPDGIRGSFIPNKIQHYPIINSKLNVLRGEASKRQFDYRVIITNPTAVSEIETKKKDEVYNAVLQLIQEQNADLYQQAQVEQQQAQQEQNQQFQDYQPTQSSFQQGQAQKDYEEKLNRIADYYTYQYQDIREMRGNAILHHYSKEQDFNVIFNDGLMDAMIVGEEIYQCEIISGEPTLRKLNNMKISAFGCGYSNRIEDADVIIMEDYWSLGKIYDTYYDSLTQSDVRKLEKMGATGEPASPDEMNNIDEREGFVNRPMLTDVIVNPDSDIYFNPAYTYGESSVSSLSPFDGEGNIRVLRMYWKSRRKIKKVTSFDPQTGEEVEKFYDEDYIIDKAKGETEKIYWINQAWEGTKIGKDIYVNIRPCPVQYNSISNPSKCNFGIIGTIYSLNENKPFSLVDMMKPYAYLYDVIHAKMERFIARDYGFLVNVDFAKMPRGWSFEKYMHYAKTLGILIQDSFNEGKIGSATGKLAGALNNNTNGGINASQIEIVNAYTQILEYIRNVMSEIVGISRQREGQVSNRETVGGVERATLQSSYITEWLFLKHEDTIKRVMEAFLETAKIAMKGKSKKFQYISDDFANKLVEIDGDEFSECDYGLVVDNSDASQTLKQNMEMLAQAALQNQVLSFSTIMKLYSTASLAEKQRMVERDEQEKIQQAQQAQQEQLQQQQDALEMQTRLQQMQLQMQELLNQRDNETKIQVAQIQANNKIQTTAMQIDSADDGSGDLALKMAQLEEQKRQFDIKAKQTDQKQVDANKNNEQNLRFNERKLNQDKMLKEKQINVQKMQKRSNNTK